MTTATTRRVPADTLAARLILIRVETGWSQREAAEHCGLTYGEWQSIENGREARGLPRKLTKISDATGYDLNWLMWGGPLSPGGPPSGDTPRPLSPRTGSNRRPTAYNSVSRSCGGALVAA